MNLNTNHRGQSPLLQGEKKPLRPGLEPDMTITIHINQHDTRK